MPQPSPRAGDNDQSDHKRCSQVPTRSEAAECSALEQRGQHLDAAQLPARPQPRRKALEGGAVARCPLPAARCPRPHPQDGAVAPARAALSPAPCPVVSRMQVPRRAHAGR